MAQAMECLEQWVAAHQAVVYRAAWLILRDRAAAEDVAQETFIRAYRKAEGMDPDADVAPWLYRIAVNLSLNRLRSRRREERALARVDQPGLFQDDAAERGATTASVAEALLRLPDRLRVPVILRYYLDLPEREIARALGVRPGTTKSRLHEARRLLAADESIAAAASRG